MINKLIYVIFFLISANSFAEITAEELSKIFVKFQDEFSHEVSLEYNKQLKFQVWNAEGKAFVQCYSEVCEVIIFSGFLQEHNINELNAMLCHEVGHLLGEKFTNKSILSDIQSSKYAIEGEADYYSSSKCLKRVTDFNEDELTKIAYDAIAMTAQGAPTNLDGRNPFDRDVRLGMNMTYPSANCRYATLIAGIKDKTRPSCWYVPNELIPLEFINL